MYIYREIHVIIRANQATADGVTGRRPKEQGTCTAAGTEARGRGGATTEKQIPHAAIESFYLMGRHAVGPPASRLLLPPPRKALQRSGQDAAQPRRHPGVEIHLLGTPSRGRLPASRVLPPQHTKVLQRTGQDAAQRLRRRCRDMA